MTKLITAVQKTGDNKLAISITGKKTVPSWNLATIVSSFVTGQVINSKDDTENSESATVNF